MGDVLVMAEDLSKVYGEVVPTPALKDVSFSVGCNEFASIIGIDRRDQSL